MCRYLSLREVRPDLIEQLQITNSDRFVADGKLPLLLCAPEILTEVIADIESDLIQTIVGLQQFIGFAKLLFQVGSLSVIQILSNPGEPFVD